MLLFIWQDKCFFRPFRLHINHASFLSTSIVNPLLNISNSTDSQFNAVSFLPNSCGISLESVDLASKKLQICSTDKPNTTLSFLVSFGLTETCIKSLITRHPSLLLADPDKALKPNFELLGTLGLSGTNLAKVLHREPRILECDIHTLVDFLRNYGFTDDQIASITVKRPALCTLHPQKNFSPKLEYFESVGLSRKLIINLLTKQPSILQRSLENQIKPSVELIRVYAGTEQLVVRALTKCSWLLVSRVKDVLAPNMALLMNRGVPRSNVLKLLMIQGNCAPMRSKQFAEIVKHVEELGFDPDYTLFILAIRSVAGMSKSVWDKKCSVFLCFGFSEDDILSAFRKQPLVMMNSEEKLKKMLGFLINDLKMKPSRIIESPGILLYSLEKRIFPRCSVLRLLISKDLLSKEKGFGYYIRMTENKFASKFVIRYQDLIPEIVDAHQGKNDFQGLSVDFSYSELVNHINL